LLVPLLVAAFFNFLVALLIYLALNQRVV
jgi:hypothetical protein